MSHPAASRTCLQQLANQPPLALRQPDCSEGEREGLQKAEKNIFSYQNLFVKKVEHVNENY
jgi:hypothetical protein